MKKIETSYYIIGVMSGTSVDGIDLVYARFTKADSWQFEILTAQTKEYDEVWKQQLEHAITLSPKGIQDLDRRYTRYLAQTIANFIQEHSISKIDGVASHGHTIFHQPETGVTLQIGNNYELAKHTKQRVICDFRVQDVKLGGQGAPLVPIGDELLFDHYEYCLNIGGFANVSFKKGGIRYAFDICPTNIVLNHYAQKIGLAYDRDGLIAKAHKPDKLVLKKLNQLPYYKETHPKSLGLEWVKQNVYPVLEEAALSSEISIATFTEHMALQIGYALETNSELSSRVLVTGGGAFNTHLITRIKSYTDAKIIVPDARLIENKEALIFGFMGVLRLRNTTNVLKSVTGAKKNHVAGEIFIP